jgi:hypothetical protein
MSWEHFPVELTTEDILQIHRDWISDLYTDYHKSAVEIVQLLYERQITVS